MFAEPRAARHLPAADMTDSAFRRLPVDLYDEDRVLVSDLYPADPRPAAQILSDTQRTAQDVRQLVQRGDAVQALKLALEQAPYDGGEQDADRQLHEAKVRFDNGGDAAASR